MSLLELRGVSGGYGSAEVLREVDLLVEPRGTTALLGANGAGKTTTLRAISGLLRYRGEILFEGEQLPTGSADKVARRGIAHVPQGRGTLRQLSVCENLLVGALRRRNRREVNGDLDRCKQMFPILGKRGQSSAGSLSGGEQQMLAIARALMSRPALLLLDEPSLGLAPKITQEVFALLPALRAEWGVAVLVVEQNAQLALAIADHAVVLETGHVALAGVATEIAGHDDVRRAYLGD